MKKPAPQLLVFCFAILSTFCYSANEQTKDLSKTIVSNFSKLWYSAPQEKVYVHTDKPYYSAGEDIWFKAYLVNASTHRQTTKSQFVYVELIDKSDSVISRVKIRKDSLGFYGNIKLSPELSPGNYALRAYTYWMQNASTDFFYTKNIFIGNKIDDRISCQVVFGTPAKGKVPVNLTFTNTYGNPVAARNVKISQSWLKPEKRKLLSTSDAKGKIQFQATIDTTVTSKKIIEISINEPGLKYKNKIFLPDFSNDFDIQFFPESGIFLDDNLQTIAFKAIGTDGLSTEVEGQLFNNTGDNITDFKSINKGMGKFIVKTNPGESYYAIVKSSNGIEKRISLPSTKSEGIGMRLTNNRGKIMYDISNKISKPIDSFLLLIHSRGVVYFIKPLKENEGIITESILPAGINSFSVIDSLGNTYCERLVFVRPLLSPQVTFNSDNTSCGKREPVALSYNILSSTGKPFEGDFSISVTDNKNVVNDTINDNMLSYLLLSSDIKGYIENPASYFADNSNATREKTDLLMLTQGWRRFNTADYVKNHIKVPEYYLEAGQTISGKVLNLFMKPAKECDVIMFSGYKNSISVAKTDTAGRFLIDGIQFPDSTTIALKAKSKLKLVDVELIVDKDQFPAAKTFIPEKYSFENNPPADYFQMIKEKYYTEGGMMVFDLDEINVTAEAKKSNNMTDFYAGMADNNFSAEKLEDYPGMGVLDIIVMMPGVQVNGQSISIRGASGNPLFVVDGIETENLDDVMYLNSFDIENIALFKGASATFFGSKGANGVIAITLKKGVIRQAVTPPSLLHITPLGFQKPAEFYMPKYEVDSIRKLVKPDLRTTIYWNPKLRTDSTGTINVKFYSADKPNNYTVILEGISKTGEICRYVGVIKRKEERY